MIPRDQGNRRTVKKVNCIIISMRGRQNLWEAGENVTKRGLGLCLGMRALTMMAEYKESHSLVFG